MTGFRVAPGGAQQRLAVRPDLTTLGKILGGGLPVGAYGGPADLVRLLPPEGPAYQAGDPFGHPGAVAAGVARPARNAGPRLLEPPVQPTRRLLLGVREDA